MSIRFDLEKKHNSHTMEEERARCLAILEGTPLGYRTSEEHEVLEDFVNRVMTLIDSGCLVTEYID